MKITKTLRVAVLACAGLMLVLALAGCAQQNSQQDAEQAANRAYMSQVNQIMENLDKRLDSFEAAVSRGDTVTMRTQADNAFKAIDELDVLEVPEVLKDVHQGYIDGCSELEGVLNAYIQLYSDIDSQGESFDYSTYDARLKEIQDKYNAGVEKLEEADKKATEL